MKILKRLNKRLAHNDILVEQLEKQTNEINAVVEIYRDLKRFLLGGNNDKPENKMKKVSEVISALQEMERSYGDLPVSISIAFKKSDIKSKDDNIVLSSGDLFFGYDQFKDKSDEINIRSFTY